MNAVIVIPARYQSQRYPGKPLVNIAGTSMLQRVWMIAKAVKNVNEVVVATDDDRIKEHVQSFGGKTIMTDPNCENGTERVFEAVKNYNPKPEVIINLQGDAVLTPPWVIQDLVNSMSADPTIAMGTTATQLSWAQFDELAAMKTKASASGTMVVMDCNNNALYFSKVMIPYLRDRSAEIPPAYRHIGLYGYRYETLEQYLQLKPTPLEKAEKLEQLRALESGIRIKVVVVDYRGRTHWSVDSPEDVKMAEKITAAEGELVALSEVSANANSIF